MKRVLQADRKQNCLVSLAPNPQRVSYDLFLADWETWERQGCNDELILQVYRMTSIFSLVNGVTSAAARRHIPVSIGILTG